MTLDMKGYSFRSLFWPKKEPGALEPIANWREYRLDEVWNLGVAEFYYELYCRTMFRYEDGSEKPDDSVSADEAGWERVASGDKAWSERIAKHYGILTEKGTAPWIVKMAPEEVV